MSNPILAEGKRAPAFTLPSTDGDRFRFTDHRGRWMIVFFYGKNKTSGAQNEVLEFQQALLEFNKMGAIVVGLSSDPLECHVQLAAKCKLSFPLLADRDSKVALKYGAWRLRKNGGREYHGIVRSTVLVDPSGKVARLWDNVRVKGHVAKVQKFLAEVLSN